MFRLGWVTRESGDQRDVVEKVYKLAIISAGLTLFRKGGEAGGFEGNPVGGRTGCLSLSDFPFPLLI